MRKCIYLAVLVSVMTIGLAADDAELVLQYQDQFDRDELGTDWAVLDGNFKAVYDAPNGIGTLHARGEALLLRQFPGDVRVEMEASAPQPCDLSIILSANERGLASGYFLGFGSEGNTVSKILRTGKKVAISQAKITPNKAHHIIAEKRGSAVRMIVDGEEILHFEDSQPLDGTAHQMVGLYFFKATAVDYVKVYGKPGKEPVVLTELPQTTEAPVPQQPQPSQQPIGNLVDNPSFEETLPGIWPRLPAAWAGEYSAVGDRPQLVKDPAQAHRGDRFLRLAGNGPWMKVHSTPKGGLAIEPGKTYLMRAWARSTQPESALLEFQPGGDKFELTEQWQELTAVWQAPEDLPEWNRGFYLKAYGSVDIDDVSLGEEGYESEVPPELRVDRTELKVIAATSDWLQKAEPQVYEERVWVEVSEVMGKDAEHSAVAVSIGELFGALDPYAIYDYVSPGRIAVVDSATGEEVPFAFKEVDMRPGLTRGDVVIFLADLPALSRKTYYVYLADRQPLAEEVAVPSRAPEDLGYDPEADAGLLVETIHRERLGTLAIETESDHKVVLHLIALPSAAPAGEVAAPDGGTNIPASFAQVGPKPLWRAEVALPANVPSGIWSAAVTLRGPHKSTKQIEGAFVVDAGMWAAGNLRAVCSDDPPQARRNTAHITAARGERESLQVVIAAEHILPGVRLVGSELKQIDGEGRIPATAWKLERVVETFVGVTHPSPVLRPVDGKFVNTGNYPDPLLPWREHDVKAGGQRVCLATLSVPHNIPAGRYQGTITATATDATSLSLPVNLRVCDFDMPPRPSFTVMICGSPAYVRVPRDREGKFGHDVRYYHLWDMEASDALPLLVADRWMTPALTGGAFGGTPIPWTYDEETDTATLDFERFDRNAEVLIDQMGVDFVSIPWSSGWTAVGRIYTYPSVDNWPASWGTAYKDSPGRITRNFDTEEGLRMMEAYARALGEHLEEKGWLDRVSIYISDEPKSDEVREAIFKKAQAIRRGHPKLRMCEAGYGTAWPDHFSYLDVFTGQISEQVWQRLRDQGSRYFGRYNQTIDYLPMTRVMALYGYTEGWDGYYHHETTTNQDAWINPEPPVWATRYAPKYAAGFPHSWNLVASTIYHWPVDELGEPLPEGQRRAWASSLRLEGLRESIEDVEYLKILERLANESHQNNALRQRLSQLQGAVAEWVEERRLTLAHNWYYNYRLDEGELQRIRRGLCQTIEQVHSGSRRDQTP